MKLSTEGIIDQFTIHAARDIAPYIPERKRIVPDNRDKSKCFNCGDSANQEWLRSTDYQSVQYCNRCKGLNVIMYGDNAGISEMVSIICYGE